MRYCRAHVKTQLLAAVLLQSRMGVYHRLYDPSPLFFPLINPSSSTFPGNAIKYCDTKTCFHIKILKMVRLNRQKIRYQSKIRSFSHIL